MYTIATHQFFHQAASRVHLLFLCAERAWHNSFFLHGELLVTGTHQCIQRLCVHLLEENDTLHEPVCGKRLHLLGTLGWRIGDVTEVCSRTENSSISPGRVMLVFMSSSLLMWSLVSGVKGTLR